MHYTRVCSKGSDLQTSVAAHIVAELRAHDEHVAQVVQRERPQLAVRQRVQPKPITLKPWRGVKTV